MAPRAHSGQRSATDGTSGPRPHAVSSVLPLPARRHRLVAEIDRRLRGRCGVPVGSRVLIGVSGGADSVALLLACAVLRDRGAGAARAGCFSVDPMVVHVHHHLRSDADDDAEFVGDLCRRLAVPFRRRDVYPGDRPGNVEANARDLRYEAILEAAQEAGADYAAVAHHGEDQLETMLIALCRGAGLEGMSGMAWTRPLGDGVHDGVQLVRPMLAARKADCEALCRAAELEWREDPTNKDAEDQTRARLRRDVLPVLEALWPDAPRRAGGVADLVSSATQLMMDRVELAFGPTEQRCWPRGDLSGLAVPVVTTGLRRAALHAVPAVCDSLGQRQLSAAAEQIVSDDRSPKRHDWPGGLVLAITSRQVELRTSCEGSKLT